MHLQLANLSFPFSYCDSLLSVFMNDQMDPLTTSQRICIVMNLRALCSHCVLMYSINTSMNEACLCSLGNLLHEHLSSAECAKTCKLFSHQISPTLRSLTTFLVSSPDSSLSARNDSFATSLSALFSHETECSIRIANPTEQQTRPSCHCDRLCFADRA